MGQRVFVDVVGFTDEERHALNLMFRMSQEHSTAFALWRAQAGEAARVAIVDGESYEAQVEAQVPRKAEIPVLWIGPRAPLQAWRKFERPIPWPEVIRALDELFPFDPTDSGFDLDLDDVDTLPPDTQPPQLQPPRRALIACASLEERLYYRAKLALGGLTVADESETAAHALELVRERDYAIAIVDLSLGGLRGWDFLDELRRGKHPIPKVIVVASRPTFGERLRARSAGVAAFLAKPPDPTRLKDLLAQA